MISVDTQRAFRINPRPRPSPFRHAISRVFMAASLVRRERTGHCRKPIAKHLRGWRRGFFGPSYTLYDLDRNDPAAYISDADVICRFYNVNEPFNPLVRNKLGLFRTLSLFGIRTPQVHALLDRGRIRALDGTGEEWSPVEWFERSLPAARRLVLKPAQEGQGRGIMFLAAHEQGFLVNGVHASRESLDALLAPLKAYLVTEFIEQAPYSAAVYAGSANTVRALTLWDLETSLPFIATAAHRFGSSRSGPIDNFHSGWGGLSARIDLATGVLGPAAQLNGAGRLEWHTDHPDSGAPIAGIRVDGWHETAATLLALAARLPETPAVGWDLIVTRDGCCVLEGNSPPQVAVWQVHGPLLADPRVRRFYEAYGVIRPR